jgi:D-glucosaminate-6-phosphate ammonia-lyase
VDTRSTIYERLGVRTIVNAKGTATRLSGGIMRPEVSAAMAEASRACVVIAELQGRASEIIAEATGAEAGYVASGAAACLLLATAACVAGLEPSRMARLPDTRDLKNEVVMVRSQRNFYDHAVRTVGVEIVEVGLPDRFAGAGVRDAEAWEIADAITERTAAVYYVADAFARPPLRDVVRVAHAANVPVIVDAAAHLPPQSNLRHYIAEGADLVAYSGGKAIGGPQASGFLCCNRDLIMSAALQHLDLDIFWEQWDPPPSLIDKARLKGVPQHGIGRPCKAGKEEIVGLLTALELFIAEGDAKRHARWLADMQVIYDGLRAIPDSTTHLDGATNIAEVPTVRFSSQRIGALDLVIALQRGQPSVHVDPMHCDRNVVVFNPMCLAPGQSGEVVAAVQKLLA